MSPIPTWILFGDSLTQYSLSREGWGTGLADLYQRKADILNRGHETYNTRWALEIFGPLFAGDKGAPPALVTIFFGANDASIRERTRHADRGGF